MQYKVNACGPIYRIECIGECNVWHNRDRQLGFRICTADFGGFVLGPNSGNYFVPSLDQNLKNVGYRDGLTSSMISWKIEHTGDEA